MRLFLAVDLDDPARAASSRCAIDLGVSVDAEPTCPPVRWVATEQLHFTVRFLGDVPVRQLAGLRQALRGRWATGAFTAGFAGLGVFPYSGPPRVIWIGMGEGGEQFHALGTEVDGRLRGCDLETAARPFRPHLTLGRVRRLASGSGDALRALVTVHDIPAARWRVDRVTLYESRLAPRGSEYRVVESATLRAVDVGS